MYKNLANDPTMIKFRANNDEGTIEDIVTYNQIMPRFEAEDGDNDEWRFKAIANHQGPLSCGMCKLIGRMVKQHGNHSL